MRSLQFWSALPFVLPQALWVRARAPRFAGPAAAAEGLASPGVSAHPRSGTPPGTPHTPSRPADRPPLRLLGIGDSLIEGVGVSRAEDCLTACCAREFAAATGRAVAWRTVGRSGATSAGVLHRLAARLPLDPVDLFLVSVGVNDVTALRRRRAWRDHLDALAALLARHSPDALAVFLGLPPLQRFPVLPSPLAQVLGLRARQLDDALNETLGAHPGARHFRFDFEARPEDFAPDGFHPSGESYARIAREVAARHAADITARSAAAWATASRPDQPAFLAQQPKYLGRRGDEDHEQPGTEKHEVAAVASAHPEPVFAAGLSSANRITAIASSTDSAISPKLV
jgi:lysophospholipase L1-like esterase